MKQLIWVSHTIPWMPPNHEARLVPTMVNHSAIYEEALRRILARP